MFFENRYLNTFFWAEFCSAIVLIAAFIILHKKSTSKNKPNNPTKTKNHKKKRKVESVAEAKQLITEIGLPTQKLPMETFANFDNQFEGSYPRKIILNQIETTLKRIGSSKKMQILLSTKSKMRKLASQARHTRYKSQRKRDLNKFRQEKKIWLETSTNLLDRPLYEFIRDTAPSSPYQIYKVQVNSSEEIEQEQYMSVCHILDLWGYMKKRVDEMARDEKNAEEAVETCVICQYPLSEQANLCLDCCGVSMHVMCLKEYLSQAGKRYGERVCLNSLGACLICRQKVSCERHSDFISKHGSLVYEIADDLSEKYMSRLEFEGRLEHSNIIDENGEFYQKPLQYAAKMYSYYMCFKCHKLYFAGLNICRDAEHEQHLNPSDRLCHQCAEVKGHPTTCPIHGEEFIQWKCCFCCSVATFKCGSTHFCERCHRSAGHLWDLQRKQKEEPKQEHLLQCPCIADAKTYKPVKVKLGCCPLGVSHPPHGTEYCLGCAECRRMQSE